jgi:hypothetical protein
MLLLYLCYLVIGVLSNQTTLFNACDFPYQYTIVGEGGWAGTLNPGESTTYAFQTTGTSFKVYLGDPNNPGVIPSNISQFEVTLWSDSSMASYDISHQNGDPFGGVGESLVPSNPACQSIICPAGQIPCIDSYTLPGENAPNAPNTACPTPFDLAAIVCTPIVYAHHKARDIRSHRWLW